MFRHKGKMAEKKSDPKGEKATWPEEKPVQEEITEEKDEEVKTKKEKEEAVTPIFDVSKKDTSPAALRELLEKNLKWSQIIYEQNRRINRKLFWSSFAGWVRLLLIVVPLALGIIFLPPLINNFLGQYGGLLGGEKNNTAGTISTQESIDQLLKILPVDPVTKEKIRGILK